MRNEHLHNGCPPESEEERREHATTLKGATDHDHDRANAEEELIEAEQDLWQVAGRSSHDILQAKVGHVTNEGSGGCGVGKGVSPEHPLEGDDANLLQSLSQFRPVLESRPIPSLENSPLRMLGKASQERTCDAPGHRIAVRDRG